MTPSDHPTRRRVLQAGAVAAALGVAGCLGAPASTSAAEPEVDTPDAPADLEDDHHDAGGHFHSPTEHDSGHGHAHGDDAVTGPADHVTFRMTTTSAGEHFEPHVSWLVPGGTATWVNESGMHSATAYHPANDRPLLMPEAAAPFDSGLMTDAGATFDHTFDIEGVYHFFCLPHESVGMLGSLIVGEPDPHDAVALGEVPTSLPPTAQRKVEHLNAKVNEALGHTH